MGENQRSYYEILGVSRRANKPDVDRAYLALKAKPDLDPQALWELERAYASLSDPNLRRKYDAQLAGDNVDSSVQESTGRSRKRGRRGKSDDATESRKPSPLRLAICALLLLLALVQTWRVIGWRFQTHPLGTTLVSRVDGSPLGEVVGYESPHDFGNSRSTPAYKIRLIEQEQELWLTKREINLGYQSAQ